MTFHEKERKEQDGRVVIAIGIIGIIVLSLFYVLFMMRGKAVEQEHETIEMGVLLPLSGNAAYYGEAAQRGIELARREAEQQYPKARFDVVYEDSLYTPKGGVNAYQYLQVTHELDAVITAASQVSLAVQPLAVNDSVVQMAIFSSASKYSTPDDLSFRVSTRNEIETAELVRFLKRQGYQHLGVLYLNNDFGVGFKEALKKQLHEQNVPLEVIVEEAYLLDTTDFRASLTKIKEKNPDVIFMVGIASQYVLILRQAYELGVKTQFLSMRSAEDPVLVKNVDVAEGLIYTYPFDATSTTQETQRFVNAFVTAYNSVPDAYAAEGYEGFRLLARALVQCKKDRECVKRYFDGLKNEPSVFGPLTFDENGDVRYGFFMKEVRNGKFVPYAA